MHSVPGPTTVSTTLYNGLALTPNGTYANSLNSTVVLAAPDGATVTLVFGHFSLEPLYDTLTLYDGTSLASKLLGTFTGTQLQGRVISSTSSGSTSGGKWECLGRGREGLCLC